MTKTLTVSTKAELIAALKGAGGGDVIQLAGGNYGNLFLRDTAAFDLDFPSTVRLVAADVTNPPVITGLDLRDAGNISFEGITFDYTFVPGQPIWHRPFAVSGSDNITFSGCRFDGDDAKDMSPANDGFPTAVGLMVTGGSGITVTQSEITGFHRGMSFGNTDNLTVTGNDVHGIHSDGMTFVAVQKVLIEDNHIHDFDRPAEAGGTADMIQFWTEGATRPSADVMIRGNTLDIGQGLSTKSIFMRNEMVDTGRAGAEMFFQNITIADNTVLNAQQTGISVGETAGLTITGNSVLPAGGATSEGAVESPRIAVAAQSTGVVITGNTAAEITGTTGQPDWTIGTNTLTSDQTTDGAGTPPAANPVEPPPAEPPLMTVPPVMTPPPVTTPPVDAAPVTPPLMAPPPIAGGPAEPQGITVSTQAELIAALKGAAGGDVILLAGGNYGSLFLRDTAAFDLDFPSTVRLVAADATNPPVITGLDLRDADNISFEGITFDYTFVPGQPIWHRPFAVSGSDNITFSGCRFDGDDASGMSAVDNGFPTGVGLMVRGGSGVTLTQSEVSGFHIGLSFNYVDNLTVTGNDVHGVRSDGMNFIAVQNVLIEDNHIHDFDRSVNSADHADMIQFWTTGTTRPSTDVIIRGNTLDVGGGEHTQSLFMRNEMVDTGLAGTEMYYRNITIEDNVIVNAHLHGISVGETAGLVIRNNSVLHSDGGRPDGADSAVEIPRINVSSKATDVVITHNATSQIVGPSGQPGWTVGMNAFVQDQNPEGPGYYGNEFITSSMTHVPGETGFLARPGGMLDTLGAGAAPTLAAGAGAAMRPDAGGTIAPDASFNITVAGGGARIFEAGATLAPEMPGTVYLWDFGDGTTAEGRKVHHSYGDGGMYQAKLTVMQPDGQRDSAAATIGVQDPTLLHLGAGGSFVLQTFGVEQVVATAAVLDAEGGIQLGAKGIAASVSRADLAPMFRSDDVTISFSIDADQANTKGELFRLHQSFIVEVNAKSELLVRADSSTGDKAWLATTGIKVNDGVSRDMDIRLEGGRLSLWVDGTMVADTGFGGTFADVGNHKLTFGNPWNAGNFIGDLTAFSISVDDGPAGGMAAPDLFAAAHMLDMHVPLI